MSEFIKASPIWIDGKEQELNCRVQFKAVCEKANNAKIHIATSGVYQLWINGQFVSYGPARAGKNHFRMEDFDISKFLTNEKNVIIIEVAGYYCSNFYVMRQPSFLQAEIVSDGDVLVDTGTNFSARINPYYYRKIQRYSFQRPFAESYKNLNSSDTFFSDESIGTEKICITDKKTIIRRTAPYPEFEKINANPIFSGSLTHTIPHSYRYDRYCLQVGMKDGETTGWKINELEFFPEKEYQELTFISDGIEPEEKIKSGRYNAYEFSHNATGMIVFDIVCNEPTRICLSFDEIMLDKQINPKRTRVCNIIYYDLSPGKHHISTFEVYTLKYLQISSLNAECEIKNVSVIEYKHPPIKIPQLEDAVLQKVADAAVETYRQNAVDIFTDCPSRERAGWLCDSYFLAKAEYSLTGKNTIEEAFLENFLHEDTYGKIPKGMLPMCYPADHDCAKFIPNWAMWFVVELKDYYERTGKRQLVDQFKKKIYELLEYFKGFENEYGLLEDLKSWVFVEWSRANDSDMVEGINYPSNMMYYLTLQSAGTLYDDATLLCKAEKVKANILSQSFDGAFFADRAVRTNTGIFTIPESTEVCQYYAFFSGVATKETHPELFKTLVEKFGPKRNIQECYPEIHPAAPFIGNYLRLEILMRCGNYSEVLSNMKGYFYYMAQKTGTLWEYADTSASCNHGFASCVLYWILNM